MSTGTSSLRNLVEEVIAKRANVPAITSTYRVQFNHEFTFVHATDLVPYLAKLGISHLYASPIFQSAPGSMHGYDVVDFQRINNEIGTREELESLVATLREHGMGLVIDYVPNHMGIEKGANAWWQDVLENGRFSRFAEYFDIDWHPLKQELRNKVLLPFLGGQYGEILERGELRLEFDAGKFTIHYWDTPFPIDPATYPEILNRVHVSLTETIHAEDIDLLELESIIHALERLPRATDDDPDAEHIESRYREQIVAIHRLAELVGRNDAIASGLQDVITNLNGSVGDPASFDDLDALLSLQPYRPSFWRVASEEINYRRFFAINTLAAIRQEDREVFNASHSLLMELLVTGLVDGVRFDHTDGLWDPERYFHDFQAAFVRASVLERLQTDGEEIISSLDQEIRSALQEIQEQHRPWPVWTVAEKILEHGEVLPQSWKLEGTVGYEFMQAANGVLVNPQSRALFDTIYARYTGDKIRYNELVYEMKLWQVREAFASELNVLTSVANRISESDRHSRDFTINSLRSALREVIACFGVYRTYTTCREGDVTNHDEATINAAVDQAIRRNPTMDASVFEFIRGALLLHHTGEAIERRYAPCHFSMKLQQLSGPVMAKGLEDTTFYRFNRLTSLNEVGGDPAKFGTSVAEFHRQNEERLLNWPRSMVNSSTHDTKRSEDVRAAISVLSERPTEWRAGINRWTRLNRKFKVKLEGALAPHRVDEWVLYQTLVGTWPMTRSSGIDKQYVNRMQEYMLKVVREAGRFSNWVNSDEAYETALREFIAGVLSKRRNRAFLADFDAFVAEQRESAIANALSQQIMKLASPGIADVYQGTELLDDSLVDPDNRRPVDYDLRLETLQREMSMQELIASREFGALKQAVTAALLQHRNDNPHLYLDGTYTALRVNGPASEHVIALMREHENAQLLVVVPRLTYLLSSGAELFGNADLWQDTSVQLAQSVPTDGWHDLLGNLPEIEDPGDVTALFANMPLAVLYRDGDE